MDLCLCVSVCTQVHSVICVHKCVGAYMSMRVHSEAREGHLVSSFVTHSLL